MCTRSKSGGKMGAESCFVKISSDAMWVWSVGQPIFWLFSNTYHWTIPWNQRFRGLMTWRSSGSSHMSWFLGAESCFVKISSDAMWVWSVCTAWMFWLFSNTYHWDMIWYQRFLEVWWREGRLKVVICHDFWVRSHVLSKFRVMPCEFEASDSRSFDCFPTHIIGTIPGIKGSRGLMTWRSSKVVICHDFWVRSHVLSKFRVMPCEFEGSDSRSFDCFPHILDMIWYQRFRGLMTWRSSKVVICHDFWVRSHVLSKFRVMPCEFEASDSHLLIVFQHISLGHDLVSKVPRFDTWRSSKVVMCHDFWVRSHVLSKFRVMPCEFEASDSRSFDCFPTHIIGTWSGIKGSEVWWREGRLK